jgi:glutamate synthase (NADPH/NADH) small chain
MARKCLSDEALAERVRGLYSYEQIEVPQRPLEEWTCDYEEIVLGYTEGEARVEALRCMQCQDPPCVKGCPAHLDIPGYIEAIVEGDYKRGLQIIMDTYPLPGTCGRICFHPCTDVCLKGVRGEPVNIPRLRRFLADSVSQYDLDYNIPSATGFRVAIIGSGPAGLTCAYHLRRKGHEVVVFEKDRKPGGTLNTIPDYRLPDDVLQDEIKVLEWLGVQIKTDTPIQGDGCIDELLKEFDAVFIAIGAVNSDKPKLPGVELEGCITGLEYLRALDCGEELPYKRMAIIGGGDVAMDALRTALRHCEVVHWIYRRSAEEMPASEGEVLELGEEVTLRDLREVERAFVQPFKQTTIREAKLKLLKLTFDERKRRSKELQKRLKTKLIEELSGGGRKLVVHLLTNPTRVLGEGRVEGLELIRMRLGEPDASGRRRPEPVEGSEFTVEVDGVVFAIGQDVDSSWLGKDHGIELDKWGQFMIDDHGRTNRPGVFAGGDGVRGPASMIEAIADGKRAAEAIDAMLKEKAEASSA